MISGGSPTSPVRSALRDATDEVHLRLHGVAPFQAIADGRLTRADYAVLLTRIHAFHVLIERMAGTSLPDLLPSRRIALLEADLAALGTAPAPPPAWTAPRGPAALGALYVAQGSIMGGKLIYRQLDALFGAAQEGRSYFRGSPEDAQRWRMLCQRLEVEGREPGAVEEMIGGAQSAFALFERCIEERADA